MNKAYNWKYQIEVPPYDKLIEVVEAFFSSFPGGDYDCELRERFKLQFRRGLWRRGLMSLGQLVPDRLVPGQFTQWPIVVRALIRPSPDVFTITIRYELHLPKSVPALGTLIQSSVEQHVQRELEQLSTYLAECIGLDDLPEIIAQ